MPRFPLGSRSSVATGGRPRLLRALVTGLAAWLVAATAPAALAQEFSVSLWGSVDPSGAAAPALTLGLDGGRAGSATVDLAVTVADAAQLDFALSENRAFGPLGNVVIELDAALRTDGAAQAELTARGVVGPAALRVALAAFSHDADRFDPLAAVTGERPRFRALAAGEAGYGLRMAGSGRLNRSLVLEVDPEVYLVGGGFATRADLRLRWLRAFADNELRLLLSGYRAPQASSAHVALGAGLVLGRGRAPDWHFTLSAGLAGDRLLPGGSVELTERLANGHVVSVFAAAEPYRSDLAAYRAHGTYQAGIGPGTLLVGAHAAAFGAQGGASYGLSVGYSLPAELR